MMSTENDILLAGVRLGRPDWGAIYFAYRKPMLCVAMRILGPDVEFADPDAPDPPEPGTSSAIRGVSAQDVVSNVILRLRERGLPPDVMNLRSYLLTAVTNEALDVWRRSRARQEGQSRKHGDGREESLEGSGEGSLAESLVDGSASVESLVQDSLLLEGTYANLHLLTEKQRHVLVERVLKERPANDVAEELGVTPQRISQLARAGARRICLKLGMIEEGKDG